MIRRFFAVAVAAVAWDSVPSAHGSANKTRRSQKKEHRPHSSARRLHPGLTLVEMLVAMTLSLLIILAVTQAFRVVGDSVMASRAVSEMAGQLRATSGQLQRDLGNITVPVRPWTDATAGLGYLEIYEGPFWDMGVGPGAAGAPPVPRDKPFFSESSVGDFDDILMFTARSDDTPFLGQVMGTVNFGPGNRPVLTYDPTVRSVIQSNVAEIAWFTRWDDWNGNEYPDPGEVTLHRRVFLVVPDLDISSVPSTVTPGQFYTGFDLSVRYQNSASGPVRSMNSLQTLSLRQNRTGHNIAGAFPVSGAGVIAKPFPYALSRALLAPQGTVMTNGDPITGDNEWGVAGVDDDGNGATDDASEAGTFGSDDLAQPIDAVFAQPWALTLGESFGNDVILSQLLAFDVKVFDPGVAVQQTAVAPSSPSVPASPELVLPGDPGYLVNGTSVAQGGYVDLFYSRYIPGGFTAPATVAPTINSWFARPPELRSGFRAFPEIVWGFQTYPTVYDPWPLFYEHDGVDQDGILGIHIYNGTDQGTDGVDNPNISSGLPENGVDDVGERETSPPYPFALRGIEVRIRIIDPASRQVRQVTVASNFVPE